MLKKLGHEVTGIEPNIGYAEYSKRQYDLNVRIGFVQNADFLRNNYDVITMWHVLEHTDDPFHVLCRLNDWLKEDGVLIVEVPNVEAVCQAPINRFHFAHLYNFNLRTLEKIGNKAGFVPILQDVSGDGGNIFMVFRKDKTTRDLENLSIEGNTQKIIDIICKHTNFRHYTSSFPYIRLIKKIAKIFHERRAIKGFSSGKDILDYYYSH